MPTQSLLAVDLSSAFDMPNVIFVATAIIAVVAIIFGGLCSIVRSKAREQSRREIAAYIAEGSMTAEQGERLMQAAPKDISL